MNTMLVDTCQYRLQIVFKKIFCKNNVIYTFIYMHACYCTYLLYTLYCVCGQLIEGGAWWLPPDHTRGRDHRFLFPPYLWCHHYWLQVWGKAISYIVCAAQRIGTGSDVPPPTLLSLWIYSWYLVGDFHCTMYTLFSTMPLYLLWRCIRYNKKKGRI